MKKIVITGGLGYIGTELCKIYSGYSWNDQIIVIDNRFISERVNQIRKDAANNYSDKVIPLIKPLLNEGHSYRQIASILNGSGVKSPKGKQIRPDLVFRMVQKIK